MARQKGVACRCPRRVSLVEAGAGDIMQMRRFAEGADQRVADGHDAFVRVARRPMLKKKQQQQQNGDHHSSFCIRKNRRQRIARSPLCLFCVCVYLQWVTTWGNDPLGRRFSLFFVDNRSVWPLDWTGR